MTAKRPKTMLTEELKKRKGTVTKEETRGKRLRRVF